MTVQDLYKVLFDEQELEIKLKNGEIYKWIYSIENIRGLRCSKCYVDKNINILLLNKINIINQ